MLKTPLIDELIRCKRRSIGLMVTQDAKLVVRAPHWVALHEIQRLVEQKEAWITHKKESFRRRAVHKPRQFVEGEMFSYRGNEYPLRFVDGLSKAVVLDGDLKIARVAAPNVREHVRSWYQHQAFEYISNKTAELASIFGLTYRSLKVNDARTRWGSCAAKGNLNFTWRLIMAPQAVVDYVIIHELMHLKEMNHSARFWNEVFKVCPDYKTHERWLKEHGHRLRF